MKREGQHSNSRIVRDAMGLPGRLLRTLTKNNQNPRQQWLHLNWSATITIRGSCGRSSTHTLDGQRATPNRFIYGCVSPQARMPPFSAVIRPGDRPGNADQGRASENRPQFRRPDHHDRGPRWKLWGCRLTRSCPGGRCRACLGSITGARAEGADDPAGSLILPRLPRRPPTRSIRVSTWRPGLRYGRFLRPRLLRRLQFLATSTGDNHGGCHPSRAAQRRSGPARRETELHGACSATTAAAGDIGQGAWILLMRPRERRGRSPRHPPPRPAPAGQPKTWFAI